MLGPWEWLIAIFLATAVVWRFWPKSWRVVPRVRFSIRWLMAAVLVVGLICGGFARWYARWAQRQALIAQLHVQQQVTGSVLSQALVDISSGRSLSFSSEDLFDSGRAEWTAQADAYERLEGRRIPLIVVKVSGGCDGGALRPITIKAAGASLEGQLLDRLIRAYRARGWHHEVIALPADK
jgi:hypothetical protein